jgi:NAD(P)-dependent dehydrogenase (short-subunit alcohol dehydrogenase family)
MGNKVLFVTGASRGFGELIVERALARGHSVVATARNPRAVIERFGELPELLTVSLDVTDEAQAHAATMAAIERFGRIDVLVNNAGYGLLGAVEEASGKEVEAVYRTNVFGLLAVTRAVLPYMRRRRSGRIINFSSIGGYVGHAGFGVYCSTKFAVEGLTEALALELQPLGIYATVVEPGAFRTDFLDAKSLVVGQSSNDCGLQRDVRRNAHVRRRREPCATGRSRETRGHADRLHRCSQSSGALAARQ